MRGFRVAGFFGCDAVVGGVWSSGVVVELLASAGVSVCDVTVVSGAWRAGVAAEARLRFGRTLAGICVLGGVGRTFSASVAVAWAATSGNACWLEGGASPEGLGVARIGWEALSATALALIADAEVVVGVGTVSLVGAGVAVAPTVVACCVCDWDAAGLVARDEAGAGSGDAAEADG